MTVILNFPSMHFHIFRFVHNATHTNFHISILDPVLPTLVEEINP